MRMPNKTDASNGSYDICRVIDVFRSLARRSLALALVFLSAAAIVALLNALLR
jgi:hypothetical protein